MLAVHFFTSGVTASMVLAMRGAWEAACGSDSVPKQPRVRKLPLIHVVKDPGLLGNMWDKTCRAGLGEVVRMINDTISILRAHDDQKVQDLSSIWQRKATSHLDDQLQRLPRSARTLQDLKQELEITDAGEQLFRLRKRVALAQFYDVYMNAQANPRTFSLRDEMQSSRSTL